MKRLALVLIFLLAGVPAYAAKWEKAIPLTYSVRPLFKGDQFICTTFLVDYQYAIWITAGHCVFYAGGASDLRIDDLPVELVALDLNADLAALRTGRVARRGIPLATAIPRPGTELVILAYRGSATGPEGPFLVRVTYLLTASNAETQKLLLVFDRGDSARGMSGGPVVTQDGKVVGVHVVRFSEVVTGEVALDDLSSFVKAALKLVAEK